MRLGDFYEVLGADAQTVSRALDLTLTGRDINGARTGGVDRIPMCGVPYHTLDKYVAALVQKGFKVAIAN